MALEMALQSDGWEAAGCRNGHFHPEVPWGNRGPAQEEETRGPSLSVHMDGGLGTNTASLHGFGQVTACLGLMKKMHPREGKVRGKSHCP